MKYLLPSAVNRGDLRRLNYNKTLFGWGSALDPAGEAHDAAGGAHDALPDPRLVPDHLSSWDLRKPRSPSIGTPTF